MDGLANDKSVGAASFWTDLKPGEHLLQCWTDEKSLLDALEGFVGAGLRAGEGVSIICTAPHLHQIEKRLRSHWLDIDRARWEQRYFPLLAHEVLAKFMGEDGMPDEARFRGAIGPVLKRARLGGRKARLFGEMVGVLWEQGQVAAAIGLERIWHSFIREHGVPLFCAYDRHALASDPTAAAQMRAIHSIVLPC